MPVDEDKYPTESDRRRFVKGVVGAAALTGVATTGAVSVNTMTAPTGQGGGRIQYQAVENTAGPAPRGMPQIPVELDDEGYLKGVWPEVSTRTEGGREITVAEEEIGGVTYSSEWFQYCGVQTYQGVRPDADQDEYFRYSQSSKYEWQNQEVSGGDRVHIDHFEDYEEWGNGIGQSGLGKPANATWRSQDLPPAETMPVQIIRSPIVEERASEEGSDSWIGASTEQGFMAILNKCTHFCCVPGFKATSDSTKFNAADDIYCQCHQSVYDPFNIVTTSFVALPRPEGE